MLNVSSLPAVSREEERQELAHLLALPELARSANLVRMLSFVCERYFDGQLEEIRESSIAIHALGRREESFDSQADPIVRVTARTLRKRLNEYYQSRGRGRRVRLILPLGQYVPQFIRVVDASAVGQVAAAAASSEPGEAQPPEPVPASPMGGADAPTGTGTGDVPASAGVLADPAEPSHRPQGATDTHTQRGAARPLPPVPGAPKGWQAKAGWIALILLASGISYWLGQRDHRGTLLGSTTTVIWSQPVWEATFAGKAGSAPDLSSWHFDTGSNNGWGNLEIETYCAPGGSYPPPCDAAHPNAYLDGQGHLVVEAHRDAQGRWTSARLSTFGLHDFQYGRIEARLKLPSGTGLWPAFWLLGSNVDQVHWPQSGSIDVMENVAAHAESNGLGPNTIRATLHGPGYYGQDGLWQDATLPGQQRVDDGFHTYGMIWSPGMIQFYLDDPSNVFFVRTAGDLQPGQTWVFDHPFVVFLSLAVGGEWPGAPDATTPNPARMVVDSVRVYRARPLPTPHMELHGAGVLSRFFTHPGLTVHPAQSVSAVIHMTAPAGIGRVYVTCQRTLPRTSCRLASPVADFTNTSTVDIPITFTGSDQDQVSPPQEGQLDVRATTVSGSSSGLIIPVRVE